MPIGINILTDSCLYINNFVGKHGKIAAGQDKKSSLLRIRMSATSNLSLTLRHPNKKLGINA